MQPRGAEELRVDHEFRLGGLRNSVSGKRHGLIRFVAFELGKIFSCDDDVFYRSRRLVLTLALRLPFANVSCHLVDDENHDSNSNFSAHPLASFRRSLVGLTKVITI